MEPTHLISEEWGSLSGLYIAEEADFMTQLLAGNYSVSEKQCVNSMPYSAFWHGHHESEKVTNSNSFLPSNITNTNYLCFSQGSTSSTDSGNVFSTTTTTTSKGTYFCDATAAAKLDSMSSGFCFGDSKFSPPGFQCNDDLRQQQINEITDEGTCLEQPKTVLADHFLQAKKEHERMFFEHAEEARSINLENPAKRLRNSFEVTTNSRNIKSKKENPTLASMSNSEEDRSVSLQLQRGASSSIIKKAPSAPNLDRRANNGAATDPQSLYARKRRERINERLKILQTLVPNGTKVDISTMLEEAVQYVKFLQLQIKLLSSDDLWMYAPIAYNGMNIGLDLTISPPTKGT